MEVFYSTTPGRVRPPSPGTNPLAAEPGYPSNPVPSSSQYPELGCDDPGHNDPTRTRPPPPLALSLAPVAINPVPNYVPSKSLSFTLLCGPTPVFARQISWPTYSPHPLSLAPVPPGTYHPLPPSIPQPRKFRKARCGNSQPPASSKDGCCDSMRVGTAQSTTGL